MLNVDITIPLKTKYPISCTNKSFNIFWENTASIFCEDSRADAESRLTSNCGNWNTQNITSHLRKTRESNRVNFPKV